MMNSLHQRMPLSLALSFGRKKDASDTFQTMDDNSVVSSDVRDLLSKKETSLEHYDLETNVEDDFKSPKVGLKGRIASSLGRKTPTKQSSPKLKVSPKSVRSPIEVSPAPVESTPVAKDGRPSMLSAPSMTSMVADRGADPNEEGGRSASDDGGGVRKILKSPSGKRMKKRGEKKADFRKRKNNSMGTEATVECEADGDSPEESPVNSRPQLSELVAPSQQSLAVERPHLSELAAPSQQNLNLERPQLAELAAPSQQSLVVDLPPPAPRSGLLSGSSSNIDESDDEVDNLLNRSPSFAKILADKKALNANDEKVRKRQELPKAYRNSPKQVKATFNSEVCIEDTADVMALSDDETAKVDNSLRNVSKASKSSDDSKIDKYLSKVRRNRSYAGSDRSVVSKAQSVAVGGHSLRGGRSALTYSVDKERHNLTRSVHMDLITSPVQMASCIESPQASSVHVRSRQAKDLVPVSTTPKAHSREPAERPTALKLETPPSALEPETPTSQRRSHSVPTRPPKTPVADGSGMESPNASSIHVRSRRTNDLVPVSATPKAHSREPAERPTALKPETPPSPLEPETPTSQRRSHSVPPRPPKTPVADGSTRGRRMLAVTPTGSPNRDPSIERVMKMLEQISPTRERDKSPAGERQIFSYHLPEATMQRKIQGTADSRPNGPVETEEEKRFPIEMVSSPLGITPARKRTSRIELLKKELNEQKTRSRTPNGNHRSASSLCGHESSTALSPKSAFKKRMGREHLTDSMPVFGESYVASTVHHRTSRRTVSSCRSVADHDLSTRRGRRITSNSFVADTDIAAIPPLPRSRRSRSGDASVTDIDAATIATTVTGTVSGRLTRRTRSTQGSLAILGAPSRSTRRTRSSNASLADHDRPHSSTLSVADIYQDGRASHKRASSSSASVADIHLDGRGHPSNTSMKEIPPDCAEGSGRRPNHSSNGSLAEQDGVSSTPTRSTRRARTNGAPSSKKASKGVSPRNSRSQSERHLSTGLDDVGSISPRKVKSLRRIEEEHDDDEPVLVQPLKGHRDPRTSSRDGDESAVAAQLQIPGLDVTEGRKLGVQYEDVTSVFGS